MINKTWLIVYYYLVWQWHITRTIVSVLKDLFLMPIPWTWVKEPSVLNMMIELHFCLSDQWMGLRYDIQTKILCSQSTPLQLINMDCVVIGIYIVTSINLSSISWLPDLTVKESLDKDNELMCERTGRCSVTLTREVGIRAWKLSDYDNHPCMPHMWSTNGGQMYAVEERLCPISMQRNPLRVTLLNMEYCTVQNVLHVQGIYSRCWIGCENHGKCNDTIGRTGTYANLCRSP